MAAALPDDCGGNPIPAHEFHYARLENLDPALPFAYRMQRGQGIDGAHDGIVLGNTLAGFSHQRATACNNWAARFVAFARMHKERASVHPGDNRQATSGD